MSRSCTLILRCSVYLRYWYKSTNTDVYAHLEAVFFERLDLTSMCEHRKVFAAVVSAAGEAHGERVPEGLAQKIEVQINHCHQTSMLRTKPLCYQLNLSATN